MTSLEIVDFINEYRSENESHPVQLRHSDFMAKVPKVLGLELSEKFRSV
ncbi:TPA: phage antirepressor protein, partial [Acinetobacter baumannii]|nr:phage antirepressor protein [Acinetobacter baumannii]